MYVGKNITAGGLLRRFHGGGQHGGGLLDLAGASGGRCASHAHGEPFPLTQRVVIRAPVVGVKELLEPLQEFKVILEAPLHQLVDWHDLMARRAEAVMEQRENKTM